MTNILEKYLFENKGLFITMIIILILCLVGCSYYLLSDNEIVKVNCKAGGVGYINSTDAEEKGYYDVCGTRIYLNNSKNNRYNIYVK